MNIESLIKNLDKAKADRVRAVYNVGHSAVDKNVNQLLDAKERFCKNKLYDEYEFQIQTHEYIKNRQRKSATPYGYCNYREKLIVLNLDHVLLSPIDEIVDTILHECAHAVDYHYYGTSGHGKNWKKISRMFGNTPLATSKEGSEDFRQKRVQDSKYAIIDVNTQKDEVKVVGSCNRRLKNMKHRMVTNNRASLGRLYLITSSDYQMANGDFNKILSKMFR